MEAAQAIALVTEFILWRDLDYPSDELKAERFSAGWSVYAPVGIDESDPTAFQDVSVGRSVFLVSDSGRVEEVPPSMPLEDAQAEFTAHELATQHPQGGSDASKSIAGFERKFGRLGSEDPPAFDDWHILDIPPGDADSLA